MLFPGSPAPFYTISSGAPGSQEFSAVVSITLVFWHFDHEQLNRCLVLSFFNDDEKHQECTQSLSSTWYQIGAQQRIFQGMVYTDESLP